MGSAITIDLAERFKHITTVDAALEEHQRTQMELVDCAGAPDYDPTEVNAQLGYLLELAEKLAPTTP